MPNEYTNVIEACTSMGTIPQIQSRLNRVLTATEDAMLKALLDSSIQLLNQGHAMAKASKVKPTGPLITTTEPYRSLIAHCHSVLRSKKPHWQVMAEQHGWAPKSAA